MKQLFAALAVGLLLGACSPGSTNPPSGIGSGGGTVNSSDGKASLEVPAGAYSTNTTLTIAAVSNPTVAPDGKALVPGSAVTISGSAPSKPITLKLKYNPTAVSALGVKSQASVSSLAIFQLVNNIWTVVPSNVDQSAQIVSALISQLGTYAILADATPTSGGALSSIQLVCTPISIPVGSTSVCVAVGKDASGTNLATQPTFSFASSDPSKATISSAGVITGVAAGSTNITASAGGKTSNTVALTVTAAGAAVASIFIEATKSSIPVGGTGLFLAYAKNSSGTDLDPQPQVTWASSNPAVATINALSGLATGVAVGTTNITATAGGKTSNTLVLTVTAASGGGGTTATYTATAIPKPAGLFAGFVSSFNNSGITVVLGMSSGSSVFNSIYVYNGTSHTPIPLPSTLTVQISGFTAKTCINSSGQVAFIANRSGSGVPAFYNGVSSAEMTLDVAASPSGLVIRDCNDSGAVLLDALTGGAGRIWSGGSTTVIPNSILDLYSSLAGNGTASSGRNYFKTGSRTAYADSNFLGAFINNSENVLGTKTETVNGAIVAKPAIHSLSSSTTTTLELPFTSMTLLDFNNNNQALISYQKRLWIADSNGAKEVKVIGRTDLEGVALNDSGWILAKDTNNANAGLILKP